MEKTHKVCQSCGMPFKNDPSGGGTNPDGSKSAKYCSYCYINGHFTMPGITAEGMQQFVKDKLKSMGIFHRIFAGLFVKGIPKLERWKK